MSDNGIRTLVILVITAVVVWAVILIAAFNAYAEDGDPNPVSKPSPCLNKTLTGGQNYGGTNISDCVTGGSGNNSIGLYGGNDWADGRAGSDSIYGGDVQDVIYGGKEGDHLEGQGGNDFLRAGCPGGCDQSNPNHYGEMFGGDGSDTLAACNNVKDVLHGAPGDYDVGYVDAGKDSWDGLEKVIGC